MISSNARHFDVVNLWLRLVLHAGVPLCFTTCLKSCRPYGAGLPHPTPSLQRTTPAPLVVMADKDPPSPTPPEDQPLVVTSRHREEERRSDPFMTDLWMICFQKKHPFHSQSFTRQQTTTNDYYRLQTFNQRLSLDRVCIFAAIIKNTVIWKHKTTRPS